MTSEKANPEIAREFDVFISHATEDKSYVEPLVKALESAGIRVWFDRTALEWGDDLRSAIDRGLANCRYGIVVFSQAFLRKKKWTEYELNALFAREKAGEKLILPIWHNISRDDLISYSPAFADRLAKISATDSSDIVRSLLAMLGRPTSYESARTGLLSRFSRSLWVLSIVAAICVLISASLYLRNLIQTRRKHNQVSIHPTANALSPAAGTVTINPKDGQKYIWIPPDTFQMGCSLGDSECYDDEKPAHSVTITKGFWMSQTLVTQAAYRRVKGDHRFGFAGEQLPVESVSWFEAKAYCEAVGGRLPTEAEWEYAGRAGSDAPRYGDLNAIAWYSGNSKGETHDVGMKQANQWGLYDMLGNVWEWVNDWYDEKYFGKSPLVDPTGPAPTGARAFRGGSWDSASRYIRWSNRYGVRPDLRYDFLGFRCLLQDVSLGIYGPGQG